MASVAKTDPGRLSPKYQALEDAWKLAKKAGEPTFSAMGITLPVEKGMICKSGAQIAFCLHPDTVVYFSTPQKTDEWIGGTDMADRAHISPHVSRAKYVELHKSWKKAKAAGEELFSAEGITLPVNKAGIFQRNTGQPVFCLHEEAIPQFIKIVPDKTEEWLGTNDLVGLTRMPGRTISSMLKTLETAWLQATQHGDKTFTADGVTLPTDKAGIFKPKYGARIFCLHKDAASQFVIPEKTSEWLAISESMKRAKSSYEIFAPKFKALEQAWHEAKQSGAETFSAAGITLPVDKAGIFKKSQAVFCIHESAIPQFSIPERTKEWLGITEMQNKIKRGGADVSAIYKLLEPAWREAKEAGKEDFTVNGLTLPVTQGGIFKGGTKTLFYLHEDTAAAIRSFQLPKATEYAAPDGWKNANMLAMEIGSTITTWQKKIEALAEAKHTEGLSRKEIQHEWVGIYKKKGKDVLYASPQAIEILLSQQVLPVPDNWKNANHLVKELHGQHPTYVKLFETLKTKKLAEGMSAETIEKSWVGTYVNSMGQTSLFASPKALAELGLSTQGASTETQHAAKGGQRSIKPGSDHLKRTGRTRARDDDG